MILEGSDSKSNVLSTHITNNPLLVASLLTHRFAIALPPSLTDMSVEGQRSRSLEMHQMHEAFLSVSARFKVLWSVFQTHSKAEDDYIWPKLQSKLGDDVSVGSHGITNKGERENKKVGRLGINEEDYEEDHEEVRGGE